MNRSTPIRLPRLAAAFLATALLSSCAHRGFVCPTQGGPSWWEVSSEHVVVRTDLDPESARAIVRELELMRKLIGSAMSERPVPLPGRIDVLAFATLQEYKDFVGRSGYIGHFQRDSLGRQHIVLAGGLKGREAVVVAHELAHMLSAQLVIRQPRWFAEGVARYYETLAQPRSGGTRFAGWALAPQELAPLKTGPVPAREVLTWTSAPNEARLYATSWLLVHMLMNKRFDDFTEYQRHLARAEEPQAAWNATFPEWSLASADGPERLDAELRAYVNYRSWSYLELEASVSPQIAVRPLSSAEVHTARFEIQHEWDGPELNAEIEEALNEDPGHVAALSILASRTRDLARIFGRRAVKAHPDDPAAWRLHGLSLPAAQHQDALKRVLELAPDRPEYLLAVAQELALAGNPEQASYPARRAVELAPWSSVALMVQSEVLRRLGRCDDAVTTLKRAIDLSWESASSAGKRANAARLARLEKACAVAEAREADTLVMDAQRAAGEDDDHRAVKLLARAIALDPRHPDAWNQLGAAHRRLGHLDEAAQALERQIALTPDHVMAWHNLGLVHVAAGRPERAETEFRREAELAPEEQRPHLSLGALLERLGRPAEALAETERAVKVAPRSARALAARGAIHARLGHPALALADMEHAVRLSPQPDVLNNAAYGLAESGVALDRASAWAEAAVKICEERIRTVSPDGPSAEAIHITSSLVNVWDTLGWVRFRQGRLADAERYIAAAARIGAGASISDHLGQVLERAGRPEEAAEAYARAVAHDRAHATSAGQHLMAIAGGRYDALLSAARNESGRLATIRGPGTARPGSVERDLQLALGADGAISDVRGQDGVAPVDGAAALRGRPHGVQFPAGSVELLVVRARYSCNEQGCAAHIGQGTAW